MSGAEIISDSLVPIVGPAPPVEPPAFNPAEIAAARRYGTHRGRRVLSELI